MANLLKIKIILMALTLFTTCAESRTMTTSWYYRGHTTASGEKFNPNRLTAAHKHLPFGTKLKLRYKGRCVTVRITDRGPFIRGRHLDISKGAARALAFKGVDKVEILSIIKPS